MNEKDEKLISLLEEQKAVIDDMIEVLKGKTDVKNFNAPPPPGGTPPPGSGNQHP